MTTPAVALMLAEIPREQLTKDQQTLADLASELADYQSFARGIAETYEEARSIFPSTDSRLAFATVGAVAEAVGAGAPVAGCSAAEAVANALYALGTSDVSVFDAPDSYWD